MGEHRIKCRIDSGLVTVTQAFSVESEKGAVACAVVKQYLVGGTSR